MMYTKALRKEIIKYYNIGYLGNKEEIKHQSNLNLNMKKPKHKRNIAKFNAIIYRIS